MPRWKKRNVKRRKGRELKSLIGASKWFWSPRCLEVDGDFHFSPENRIPEKIPGPKLMRKKWWQFNLISLDKIKNRQKALFNLSGNNIIFNDTHFSYERTALKNINRLRQDLNNRSGSSKIKSFLPMEHFLFLLARIFTNAVWLCSWFFIPVTWVVHV